MERKGELRAILNCSNQGVGPARNQGFTAARGEYVLSLDVDTRVTPGAIEELLQMMEFNSEVGLCGARLQGPNDERRYTCGKLPTLHSKLFRQLPFGLGEFLLRKQQLLDWDRADLRYVSYVIGACQMIRRRALEQVGLYDPAIFYGPEDVDLCLRMWLVGWKVLYDGRAVIIHTEQRITKKWSKLFSRTTRAHIKGLAYYFWKHRYLFRPPLTLANLGAPPLPLSSCPPKLSRAAEAQRARAGKAVT